MIMGDFFAWIIEQFTKFSNYIEGTTFGNWLSDLIKNMTVQELVVFFSVWFGVIWIVMIIWIIRDITNRTTNFLFQFFCLLLSFIPILGWILYFIIRPSSTLEDRENYDIEANLAYLGGDIGNKLTEMHICVNCGFDDLKEEFRFCPICSFQVIKKCKKCKNDIEAIWGFCPYCGEKNNSIPLKREEKLSTEFISGKIAEKENEGWQNRHLEEKNIANGNNSQNLEVSENGKVSEVGKIEKNSINSDSVGNVKGQNIGVGELEKNVLNQKFTQNLTKNMKK